MARKNVDRVRGIDRRQDDRLPDDPADAEQRNHREPDRHDRSEQAPDTVRAVALYRKDGNENHDSDRHDVRFEQRRRDGQTFDRTEHRDGWRNHAVAIQQCGADDAKEDEHRARTAPSVAGRDQRGQREDAALALVVGAHHDHDVLDRDHQHEGVDDERQDAKDVLVRRRHGVRAEEALAHRVEGTGADVAVDDAKRRDGQGKETASAMFRERLMIDQRRRDDRRRVRACGTVRQKTSNRRRG